MAQISREEANPSSSSSHSSSAAVSAGENTPLLSGNRSLSSQPKTFANVFIALVGAGVLGLPYTFMKTGWLISLIMIFSVAALTYHCMMLLIRTRIKLRSSLPQQRSPGSADINYEITSFGDLGFAICGPIGRFAVDVMIVLSQVGFCVGYLIFIGNTMANIFHASSLTPLLLPLRLHYSAGPRILGISAKSFYIWSCFPFQLGLNSIPTLTLLAPLSIFADIVDLGAMGVVMAKDACILVKRTRLPVEAFGSLSTFFYGLGVAMFSFEGIAMALPLESEARDKNKFGKILGFTMVLVAFMYASFGVLGYFAYGDHTMDIITSNMGGGLLSALVQIGLCINLFFTFPLMMNPVYEVCERRLWDGGYCVWIRWMMVLGVTLVSLLVPNFADFLSLVGSSTCCFLGFVLPALFHFQAFKHDGMARTALLSDVTIIILGVFLGVAGTWYSLLEIFSVKQNYF